MGYSSPELTIKAVESIMGKDIRMFCVNDSSFNLLSKCQAYPTLGLALDIGVSLALWVLVGRLPRKQMIGPKESITKRW